MTDTSHQMHQDRATLPQDIRDTLDAVGAYLSAEDRDKNGAALISGMLTAIDSHLRDFERVELARRKVNPRSTADHPEYTILVYLPFNRVTPFVTWRECRGSTYWGHYHRELSEAVRDFEER